MKSHQDNLQDDEDIDLVDMGKITDLLKISNQVRPRELPVPLNNIPTSSPTLGDYLEDCEDEE